jgi:hypothetical protein
MKAEHRKELETNVLAQQLEKAYQGLRQGPSRTTILWIVGIVAVLLIYFLFRYFMSSSEAATSERWLELDDIVFPEQLETVLKKGDLKDTPQGRLARFKEARLNLSEGVRILGNSPTDGVEKIENATKAYEELAKSSLKVALLHQEALWGAAKGNEALGNIEQATSWYTKLKDEYPTSALGEDAKNQLKRLESPQTQADLAALKKALSATRTGKSE